ncbi:hypothetical protein JOF56_010993 [Kibdelosporangium banguiense]|uniref:Uncharacterized protein n=1 Tax=Kibdelosporangium banguiense TaxID=1365924 RepID=A0ABS4U345_9PSEU|nr:hypothetical protein [Kibdelosporangium banguiense]MBP2330608.1 hypothetical protein [Kibdelosporangium banguiense]
MDSPEDNLEKIYRSFTGREPGQVASSFFSALSYGDTYIQGTAVQAIKSEWVMSSVGLILPKHVATPPSPIDQVVVYLTAKDILGTKLASSVVISQLSRIPLDAVISFAARVLSIFRAPSASRREVDERFAKEWFIGPTQTRVLNLLRDPSRGLVVPQAILALIKYAMLYSGDSLVPGVEIGNVVLAMVAITDYLNPEREVENSENVITKVPGALGRELISNQVFNADPVEMNLFARFIRTWLQLPQELVGMSEIVDLEKVYQDAVGVPLRDVMAVALVLWAATTAKEGAGPFEEYFAVLKWTPERIRAAVSVFCADVPTFRAEVLKELKSTDWEFSAFGRYPAVTLYNGHLAVIDPALLLKRVFGWLPIYDIKFPSTDGARDRKRAAQAEQCLRRLAEIYTSEVLDSLGASTTVARRVFHDRDLRGAFSSVGVRVADTVVDYGDAWIVIEVTTSQLRRESVAGISDADVVGDLDKLVGEVEQIDSTITSLRVGQEKLTGTPCSVSTRFFPLLVLTEGFPVNPISLTLLREKVEECGLLIGDDVMPLEVVDVVELEMVEGIQEGGGPSLLELLDRKRKANLWRSNLRGFIVDELKLAPRQPRRVLELWEATFKELLPIIDPDRDPDTGLD